MAAETAHSHASSLMTICGGVRHHMARQNAVQKAVAINVMLFLLREMEFKL